MANDGSIIQKGRNHFEVQISTGKDPITGRYKRISRTVRGTKQDAKRVRDQIKNELESGIKANSDKVTFRKFVEEWTEWRFNLGRASKTTISQEHKKLLFVCEFIGGLPMRDIDARLIERLYPEIRSKRLEQGYGCSDTTLHSYHVMLKALFKKAVHWRVVVRNPLEEVEAPPLNQVERQSLSTAEASRLLRCIDDAEEHFLHELEKKENRQRELGNQTDRSFLLGMNAVSYILAVRIGLATGMRLGETLALKWDNVSFQSSRIFVTQALDNKGNIKEPKSAAGKRSIFVDPPWSICAPGSDTRANS